MEFLSYYWFGSDRIIHIFLSYFFITSFVIKNYYLEQVPYLNFLMVIDGWRSFDFLLSNEMLQNWAFEMYVLLSLLLLIGGCKEKKADKIQWHSQVGMKGCFSECNT